MPTRSRHRSALCEVCVALELPAVMLNLRGQQNHARPLQHSMMLFAKRSSAVHSWHRAFLIAQQPGSSSILDC